MSYLDTPRRGLIERVSGNTVIVHRVGFPITL
jgi:hypothetical protein